MKIIDMTQGSETWKAWRQTGIGASDSAAILGQSKFSTPYQLFLEKKGIIPGFSGNAATQAGTEAEAKARATYEMLHGDFETFEPICVQHEKYPFMLASLDGYNANLKRILEIKYPSEQSHMSAKAGTIPHHYYCQIQHQLACCNDADVAHYWSFREADGVLVQQERNDLFINEILLPAVCAFKEMLDNNTPPPLTAYDAKWMDDEVTLGLFNELMRLKDDKNEKNRIAELILEMADHPKVRTPLGLVTSVQRNGKHSYYKITAQGE